MGDDQTVMHQPYDTVYVTNDKCALHHQIMEGQLELLRQKDKQLDDKITGIENRLEKMDEKMDKIMQWQAEQYKVQLGIAVVVVITLIGVLLGRGLDFGLFV